MQFPVCSEGGAGQGFAPWSLFLVLGAASGVVTLGGPLLGSLHHSSDSPAPATLNSGERDCVPSSLLRLSSRLPELHSWLQAPITDEAFLRVE